MRLALVVTGGVDRSGREHVIPALLSYIERQAARHALVVYVLRYHDEPCSYPLLGATVHDLGRPSGVRRQYLRLLDRVRRDGPFDVIHAYWALPAGLVAAAVARRVGVPSVVTLDSGELVALPDIGYGLQLRWRHRAAVAATLRLATRLTVCTEYMQRLARAHGYDPAVVPFGVDAARFIPSARGGDPPWRLLHVANLNPVKDQTTLLHAFREVRSAMPHVRLDIAGRDTMGGAVQALADRFGLAGDVVFHGPLTTDELVPLYQRAHLHVTSSRHEAAGVVALEAAACGVPTVGSAVGYVGDWQDDRAVAVPPRSPEALAAAIVALLRDEQRRQRIADAARAWTLAHDAGWTADRFDRFYHDLSRD